MPKLQLVLGACALALAACTQQEGAAPPSSAAHDRTPNLVAYRCGALTVKFDPDSGALIVGEETLILTATASASGAKYVGPDGALFWSKGDRATLTLKGVAYPECVEKGTQADASGGEIFRARGNEPGWLLELGTATYKFTGDYGDVIVGGDTPAPEMLSDGFLYTAPESDLSIRIYDKLCNDDATGAPFPKRVTVSLGDRSYSGCGGESARLLLGEWKVTHIAGAAVAANSQTSVGFDDDRLVFGNSSCNRYSGKYALTPERLAVEPLIATEMACVDDALMAQERQFLDQLQSADRFDIAADGSLVLYSSDKEAIRAHR